MKFKNVQIVVRDIEQSKNFYKELFGLNVVAKKYGLPVRQLEGMIV